ncbi:ABC transporter ATP-binding protein [Candidatus Methylacidithermus pantelleriae]|uniref:ABC transporter ATP-binding protein n=1 Tax=Candidatus Methylacidithermus pantelleriae TaxID=2744239 RepID=UPI00157BCEFB|nr:ABC transporter ATP-binding protein [Candidatus Methylacidithermus pantelleriae]
MQRLARLLSLLRPYWKLSFLAGLCSLGQGICAFLFPICVEKGVDQWIGQNRAGCPSLQAFGPILVLSVGSLFGFSFFRAGEMASGVRAGQRAIARLRQRLFSRVLGLPLEFFESLPTGSLVARLSCELDRIEPFLSWGIGKAMASVTLLVWVGLIMAWRDLRLLGLLGLFLGAAIGMSILLPRKSLLAQEQLAAESSKLAAGFAEAIRLAPLVQALAGENRSLLRLEKQHARWVRQAVRSRCLQQTYLFGLGILAGMAHATLLGYGAYLVWRNKLTIGELTALLLYLGILVGPIRSLGELSFSLLAALIHAERAWQLLQPVHGQRRSPARRSTLPIRGEIIFQDVFFRYPSTPEHTWVLQGISAHIEPGKRVALVGPTGSGKSTLAALLLGFYEPQRGRIEIDGEDLRSWRIQQLRKKMVWIPQESFVFSGTVLDNLRWVKPRASLKEVQRAAKELGVEEWFEELPCGYLTEVGPAGSALTSGQKEILALLWAFLANPKILILDEATASLDSRTEEMVQRAFQKLSLGKTTLIVSHRLSSVNWVDEIWVLERGLLVEKGTHKELVQREGRYRSLYESFCGRGK